MKFVNYYKCPICGSFAKITDDVKHQKDNTFDTTCDYCLERKILNFSHDFEKA